MILDAWATLPDHPKVLERMKSGEIKDEKDKLVHIRSLTMALMTNFLKGILVLPSHMRIMAIQHFMELCEQPMYMEVSKRFEDEAFKAHGVSVAQVMMFKIISTNYEKPEYVRET